MKDYKNLIYALACLSFSIVIGGGVYEHLAVWPMAFDSPPQSLSMFQGEFGVDPEAFWLIIHPITLLLLIISLLLSWKTERRQNVLITLIGYLVIIVVTAMFLVPELVEIVGTNYENTINQELVDRGSLWEILSIIRTVISIVLAIILFFGLTKSKTNVLVKKLKE